MLRGRRPRTTYLYEDPDHPERVTGAISDPWWTSDDRSLLLGLETYEATLCPGCGQPKEVAWHSHAQASWKSEDLVCHACTERAGHQVAYSRMTTSITPAEIDGLPPFEWGETTTTPDPPPAS